MCHTRSSIAPTESFRGFVLNPLRRDSRRSRLAISCDSPTAVGCQALFPTGALRASFRGSRKRIWPRRLSSWTAGSLGALVASELGCTRLSGWRLYVGLRNWLPCSRLRHRSCVWTIRWIYRAITRALPSGIGSRSRDVTDGRTSQRIGWPSSRRRSGRANVSRVTRTIAGITRPVRGVAGPVGWITGTRTAVVAAPPVTISDIHVAVINNRVPTPICPPSPPSPSATAAADHCSDGDADSKGNNGCSRHVRGAVPWHHNWRAINYSWVVRRYVDDLRIRRLNDDCLGTFPDDLYLRT